MRSNVIVSITGSQLVCGSTEGSMELVTEGNFYRLDKEYVLEYDESVISGMYGTRTRITIGPFEVGLIREGRYNAHFVFEKWKTYKGSYGTPDGVMDMKLMATELSTSVDEATNSGDVDVVYELAMGGAITNNQLHVRFRHKPDAVQYEAC